MNVLFIDNASVNSDSLGHDLGNSGYIVDISSESEQAIELATTRSYDLIVLDLVLPRESSLLLLHEIRESNRQVKILLLSEREQIHDRITALIQGADDFLLKPFTYSQLKQRVQKLLDVDEEQGSGYQVSGPLSSDHTHQLIAELIAECNCDHGPIELVISEIKATELFHRVSLEIQTLATNQEVHIELPRGRSPTLLTDARLIQHLLIKLMLCAIDRCPKGRGIALGLDLENNNCTISITAPVDHPMQEQELKRLFGFSQQGRFETATTFPIGGLSLAQKYAERMNLVLTASSPKRDLLRIEVSNIRTN